MKSASELWLSTRTSPRRARAAETRRPTAASASGESRGCVRAGAVDAIGAPAAGTAASGSPRSSNGDRASRRRGADPRAADAPSASRRRRPKPKPKPKPPRRQAGVKTPGVPVEVGARARRATRSGRDGRRRRDKAWTRRAGGREAAGSAMVRRTATGRAGRACGCEGTAPTAPSWATWRRGRRTLSWTRPPRNPARERAASTSTSTSTSGQPFTETCTRRPAVVPIAVDFTVGASPPDLSSANLDFRLDALIEFLFYYSLRADGER